MTARLTLHAMDTAAEYRQEMDSLAGRTFYGSGTKVKGTFVSAYASRDARGRVVSISITYLLANSSLDVTDYKANTSVTFGE